MLKVGCSLKRDIDRVLGEWKVDSDTNKVTSNCGPTEAAKRLKQQFKSHDDMVLWAHVARNEAILGSCPKSLASVRSGMRCWQNFARDFLGIANDHIWRPTVEGLLCWSRTFRHV